MRRCQPRHLQRAHLVALNPAQLRQQHRQPLPLIVALARLELFPSIFSEFAGLLQLALLPSLPRGQRLRTAKRLGQRTKGLCQRKITGFFWGLSFQRPLAGQVSVDGQA